MSIKTSKKEVLKNYKNVIGCGYCAIERLLQFKEPTFNTSGQYGWNADIYIINNQTVICTGYRPFGNFDGNKLSKKYNEEAEEVLLKAISYDEQKQTLDELLENFVNEVINN